MTFITDEEVGRLNAEQRAREQAEKEARDQRALAEKKKQGEPFRLKVVEALKHFEKKTKGEANDVLKRVRELNAKGHWLTVNGRSYCRQLEQVLAHAPAGANQWLQQWDSITAADLQHRPGRLTVADTLLNRVDHNIIPNLGAIPELLRRIEFELLLATPANSIDPPPEESDPPVKPIGKVWNAINRPSFWK